MKLNNWQLISIALIACAVAASLWSHSLVLKEFYMPTFGNTGMHAAPAHEFVETGYYPKIDSYSYGGGIPFLYVPLYRVLVGALVMLTGLSLEAVSRLSVMLVGALLPIAFYLLGRKAFNERVGLFAAFFSVLPAELLIYTVRPLPQALGMLLIPIVLWLLLERNWAGALIGSLALALTHQESALVLAGAVFVYGIALFLLSLKAAPEDEKRKAQNERRKQAFIAIGCWAVMVAAYFAWQFVTVGHLNLFSTAQFVNHEGSAVGWTEVANQTGVVVQALFFVGLAAIAARIALRWKKKEKFLIENGELIALALTATCLVLIKNDLIGINVLMQRFIAYLDQAIVLVAAIGASEILALLILLKLPAKKPSKN